MLKSQLPIENLILSALPRLDYLRMKENLVVCKLVAGDVMNEPNEPIEHVYFPCTALLSLLTPVSTLELFTVGLVGREGMIGATCAFGVQVSPFRTFVQSTGRALRMRTEIFLHECQTNAGLLMLVQHYLFALTMQIAQTAACNRFHVIEERVARWLLMTRDKLSSNHFHMTHEMLSQMIGVHRIGITQAANALKKRHLIDYSRGEVYIIDGAGLQEATCSCYCRVSNYWYGRL